MKNLSRHPAAVLFTFVGLPLLTLCTVRAQQATPPPPPRRPSPTNQPAGPPVANRTAESVNQRALDLEMLSTVGRRDRSGESRNMRLAAQLVEDFDRLWRINNDTIGPLMSAEAVDYKNLSKATSEIRHRATRIKYTIVLNLEDKKSEKVRYEADAAKLSWMLPELNRVMKSFLENPVFHVNAPNDMELRSAAGNDLEAIINLSQTINKVAKSLSKAASPNK